MKAMWLALFLGITVWTISVPVSGNAENKLIKDLMKMSAKNARPLKKSSDTLKISFGLSFQSFRIDEKDLTVTAMCYETAGWQDQILNWDPELYAGIDQVVLDQRFIWTPDITLYNSGSDVDVEYGQGNAIVYSKGDIVHIRTSKSKVFCEMDSLRFPFDVLNCSIVYGSWAYDGYKIDISLNDDKPDLTSLRPNPSWDLHDIKAKKVVKYYACCPEPYMSIVYTMIFHRASSHYVHTLIFPSFLLSVLTILLFFLPTHSSLRITLGVLLFCAFFVLLLYTSSLVSGWQQLPYFVIFLAFNLVIITIFTFLHAMITNLADPKKNEHVPKIVRTIMFGVLARLFCMKSIVERNRSRHLVAPAFQFQPEAGYYNKLTTNSEKPPLELSAEVSVNKLSDVGMNGYRSIEADVSFLKDLSSRYGQRMKECERREKISGEWNDLSLVINRFFFIIYKIIMSIAAAVVFIQLTSEE